MTFGITRVHGSLIAPKNFAGVNLEDFTLTFWVGNTAAVTADYNSGDGTPNGALDQIFRTAASQFATISRVGTLQSNALRFAIESLGTDAASTGTLGMGVGNDDYASTAAALQAAVQGLGTVTFTGANTTTQYTVNLSSATVVAFKY